MFLKSFKGLKWEAQEKWELRGSIVHPRSLAAVNDGHMAESLQNSLDSHIFGYLPNTKLAPAEINGSPVLNLRKARPALVLWVCVKKMVQTCCHKIFPLGLPSSHWTRKCKGRGKQDMYLFTWNGILFLISRQAFLDCCAQICFTLVLPNFLSYCQS